MSSRWAGKEQRLEIRMKWEGKCPLVHRHQHDSQQGLLPSLVSGEHVVRVALGKTEL